MRLLPSSLFGRLVLTLVAGLLLAQLVSAALTLQDRGRALHRALGWQVVQRVVALVRLLDALEPHDRARVEGAFSAPPLLLRLAPVPLAPPAGVQPGPLPLMLGAMLRHRLGAGRVVRIARIEGGTGPSRPTAGPPARLTARRPERRRPMRRMHERMMGEAWLPASSYLIQVQLADGGWAIFRHFTRPEDFDWPWKLFAGLAVLLASVVALALFVVRRITRPLAMLAGAAEALGRDINAPPLPEDGPSEVNRAARAFNTMQTRLARYIDDRSRILAAVSHDLKTPLTRLRLRSELLDDARLRDKLSGDLDDMQQMVDAALDFARGLDAEEALRPVDINALLESLGEDARDEGHAVTVIGAAARPYRGRALALKRCIANLLGNAVRYAGAGAVEVRVEDDAQALVLHILDRGPGIPAEQLERVFDPFHRLEPSRSRDAGGTGLGLSIARNVARTHGGELTLRNRTGGGLEALLKLPR